MSQYGLPAALILLGAALVVWPVVRTTNETARRRDCRAHLKQIALALHTYHDRYDMLPPAYVLGPDGRRWHSWRVLLLPDLGQDVLYREYRFDEPWNGPHNRSLAEKMPEVFGCPAARRRKPGLTNYLAVVGRATAWPEQYSASFGDFRDGASNTIELVESADSDVLWHEPRDLTHRQALAIGAHENPPTPGSNHPTNNELGQKGIVHVALADGAIRAVVLRIHIKTWAALLSINAGRPLAGVDWPAEDVPLPGEPPAARPAAELPRSDVVPHPNGEILPNRNYVYCATFELVWDELRQTVAGDPIRLEGAPPLADALNASRFAKDNLSDEAYVAVAGSVESGVIERIVREVARKFPSARPRLPQTAGEYRILLYAYLQKSLPFRANFDRLTDPLSFHSDSEQISVAAFGLRDDELYGERGDQLKAQVTVCDYAGDDDFVLRSTTANGDDDIMLAKMAPGKTLAETIDRAQARIAAPDPRHAEPQIVAKEPLAIPVLGLGVERTFDEFAGRKFLNAQWIRYRIIDARQIIRFRLDETGAQLVSEAAVVADDVGFYSPPGKRRFIFNQPFLLYLIRRGATQPYFAAWIANAEFMEPAR